MSRIYLECGDRTFYGPKTEFIYAMERLFPRPSPDEVERVEREFAEYITYYNQTFPTFATKEREEIVATAREANEVLDPGIPLEKILWDFFKAYLEGNQDDLESVEGYEEVLGLYSHL